MGRAESAMRARLDPVQLHAFAHRIEAVGAGKRKHHRQRLLRPVLARAQSGDRGVVRRIAHQMIAADALDRDDEAVAKRGDGGIEGGVAFGVGMAVAAENQFRPAFGTGQRLGMEAAVGRVLIFGAAGVAQFEARHRGALPVVGQAPR